MTSAERVLVGEKLVTVLVPEDSPNSLAIIRWVSDVY